LKGVFQFDLDDDTSMVSSNYLLRDKYHDAVGLPNIGNTCYMNSLLQLLASSEIFKSYVRKLWHTVKLNPEDRSSIVTFRLLELLLNLSKGSSEASPHELYSLLCESEFT